MLDWAEKHRPRTLDGVVGNPSAVSKLTQWAEAWEGGRPKKRAVVLVGAPGIGKTSACHALARDFGWGLVEMNASDKRNAKAVRHVATRAAIYQTFADDGSFLRRREGGLKLIVLDEADNLFGREDYGGIGAIVDTIKATEQPIALIVNDYYELSRRSSAIKRLTDRINFQRARADTVVSLLSDIADLEGVRVEPEVLEYIADRANGDLRGAINDLQALAVGKEEVTEDDLLSLGYRDESTEVFDALSEVFHSGDLDAARRSTYGLDEDPERFILWVDENLPRTYRDPEDLDRGVRALARADAYLGRVRTTQQYGLWRYASDLMTGGVSVARQRSYAGGRFRFPLWLVTMSRSRGIRSTMDSLFEKMGKAYHVSRRRAMLSVLPTFRHLYRRDERFRIVQTARLELEPKEVAYLLDEKTDSKAVKRTMEGAEALQSPQAQIAPFSRFES